MTKIADQINAAADQITMAGAAVASARVLLGGKRIDKDAMSRSLDQIALYVAASRAALSGEPAPQTPYAGPFSGGQS